MTTQPSYLTCLHRSFSKLYTMALATDWKVSVRKLNKSCLSCYLQVHFRGNERISFDYTLSKKYVGDVCRLTILRQGKVMDVEVNLDLITTLVPTQMYDKRPR